MWWQRAWYAAKVRPILWLLLPLHSLFVLISSSRRWLYQQGWLRSYRAPVPLVIVGNINVGGSGKTPVTLAMVDYLQRQGWRPGIISRGYGGSGPFPLLVDGACSAHACGDEPWLLQRRAGVPLMVAPDRVQAAQQLCQVHPEVNILVADDGLQHYRLQRDIEVIVIDSRRGFGNGWRLPLGPLREPPSRLQQADFCVRHAHTEGSYDQFAYQIVAAAWRRVSDDAEVTGADFSGALVIAGIADPERFFTTVRGQKIAVAEYRGFADHHPFSAADFADLEPSQPVLMTEKDAAKCRAFAQPNWYYLPISAQFNDEFWRCFDARLAAVTSDSKRGNSHGN
ncbi:tetraacyldisaccharide 4'-kinase [Pseudidiomarina mangrovi]|uniref:tetraacyldisaccharide 4'-kinase n=1 Tax=Pseudidiomarina mangrovi TaxID=2487133 RepID=UPI000FC9EE53|nr:tetraacyldisaccharide 4'-kinase [Pseudidiomarina mangrovi]